ncbi:MAG: hypothetical protein GF387_01805 [Candidatus Portnoybacteria bacterium]|nr:hypothetical protein [Candidatus Portnoybacteria bacterium]
MNSNIPKNTEKYYWTNHVTRKMQYYQLSESRVKRIIKSPKRKELGVAPNTIAVMQPSKRKLTKRAEKSNHASEVWAMYQLIKRKNKEARIKIITAWRYPGKSPIRGPIPVPPEILEELGEIKINR